MYNTNAAQKVCCSIIPYLTQVANRYFNLLISSIVVGSLTGMHSEWRIRCRGQTS